MADLIAVLEYPRVLSHCLTAAIAFDIIFLDSKYMMVFGILHNGRRSTGFASTTASITNYRSRKVLVSPDVIGFIEIDISGRSIEVLISLTSS